MCVCVCGRKMAETEQHNRELVSLAAKKEESLQRAMVGM